MLDAIVRPIDDGAVELEFVLGGHILHTRVWPTRAAAEEAAETRLRELQRAGWATHW